MKKKYLPLCLGMFILGVFIASWQDVWAKEKAETIMAATMFVSIINLVLTGYIAVESAVELRIRNKKMLFANYCARFSNEQNLSKVAEWLMDISELDFNDKLKVYPMKSKDDRGKTIIEPTRFEKERFLDFLVESNNQVKNEQICKKDVNDVFSIYAFLFSQILHVDKKTKYIKRNHIDFSELLSENIS